MKYSTKYDYATETLLAVADFCCFWDQCKKISKRIDKALLDERNLYLQYMFINHASSPLTPDKELIEKWLAPAKYFEIYNLRLEILNRLYAFTKNEVFKYQTHKIHFPNFKELFFWRQYHQRIYEQTRSLFENITTEDIVKSELALWPFYDSMTYYFKKKHTEAALDFFLESHADVSELLKNNLVTKTPMNILDIGCGDGRLLLHIREKFPNANLYATNFFETTGIDSRLLSDSKFLLKVCTLEEMDYQDNFFDAILSTEVIEHLRNPEDMLVKIKKHLKKDGVFIITAPSVHTRFLSANPLTYLAGFLSVFNHKILPPFHNLYEGMTDLPIVHYAFSHQQFRDMFRKHFTNTTITTSRFTHLRKFRMHNIASKIPYLSKFGGLVMAYGKN